MDWFPEIMRAAKNIDEKFKLSISLLPSLKMDLAPHMIATALDYTLAVLNTCVLVLECLTKEVIVVSFHIVQVTDTAAT